MSVRLSVNVNKVATLRNARGGATPSMHDAVETILAAGARGITVHPREDERHITAVDLETVAAQLADRRDSVEFNVEGDPRPDLMARVRALKPHQCTLVPVRPGEITSEAGWDPELPTGELDEVIASLKDEGIRVSVFVEANRKAVDWAVARGADRIELYTEPYARAHERSPQAAAESFAQYGVAATHAHACGLEVNAGHDLDLDNLALFMTLPHLAEVSIGHALMSRALFVGLPQVVREYLDVVEPSG